MRFPLLIIPAVLAVAAPASASPVLEYQGGGRLVARDAPYLPPRQGPEAAGYERGPGLARPGPAARREGSRRGRAVGQGRGVRGASPRRHLGERREGLLPRLQPRAL